MAARVVVKEEDLLPVYYNQETGVYECEGVSAFSENDPDSFRRRGLRLISISEEMKKRSAEAEEKKHEQWRLDNIVPLALVMHNQRMGVNVSEDVWLKYYLSKDSAVMAWVETAETAYKHLNPQDADK